MRLEDLFSAIGNMDDRYIDDRPIEDIRKPQRLPLWSKLVAACACVAVLVLSVVSIWEQDQTAGIVYPSENVNARYFEQNASWFERVYFDYAELAEMAEVIVVADVTDIVLEHAKGYDETVFRSYAKISVCEVLKGDLVAEDVLYICDNGYSCVDPVMSLTFSGGPLMEKGNRVLLFVQSEKTDTMENGQRYYSFLSIFLGPFFYDADGKYHEVRCYSEIGVDRKLFPTSLVDYEPKTLDEIKRLIEE